MFHVIVEMGVNSNNKVNTNSKVKKKNAVAFVKENYREVFTHV